MKDEFKITNAEDENRTYTLDEVCAILKDHFEQEERLNAELKK